MIPAAFYGKKKKKKKSVVVRVAGGESEDSCLSASCSNNDEDYVPTSRESVSSSSEDGISDEDDTNVPDADNILAPSSSCASNKRRPVWRKISKDNSARDIPQCLGSIAESTAIKEPVDYCKHFFDSQLLEHITQQSNLYSVQKTPSKALQLSVSELEQFICKLQRKSINCVPEVWYSFVYQEKKKLFSEKYASQTF